MARKKRNQFDVDEIYRGLRTNIEFSQMDDAIQVINVVSTIPNEGFSVRIVSNISPFVPSVPVAGTGVRPSPGGRLRRVPRRSAPGRCACVAGPCGSCIRPSRSAAVFRARKPRRNGHRR